MKYVAFALLSITLAATAQTLLKMVAMTAQVPLAVLKDFRFYIGGMLLLCAFGTWMIAASRLSFSQIIPMNALTIVLAGAIGIWLFKETVSKPMLLAYALILIGVTILSLTKS